MSNFNRYSSVSWHELMQYTNIFFLDNKDSLFVAYSNSFSLFALFVFESSCYWNTLRSSKELYILKVYYMYCKPTTSTII